MANDFQISLVGSLNRSETIKNINQELAKIANSNQLNGINLEISQITLSNQARDFLQHLDITAEINHIVADAGEMRRQGEQLGEQVTEGLNRGINRSDRIIQNFRKSLENIRFNPLNNSGQGFLDETEINRIIEHIQGIRNESGQTVIAIEDLKATLTETTGKKGKTLLNVRVSGLDELGQAINMTQQWEINSEGLSKELNRTVTDVATATEKAASTTTSFLTKQTNAVAKYNREVATLQAKITDQNAAKPILNTEHLSQINTQINLINSRIQTLASSTAGTFTQAENDVKQEINQLKILADSFRLAETAATALRAKPVDVVRKETLSKLDAFAQKVKKAQGDTSGFVGIITTAQAALRNEEITAAQLREVLDSLAIGASKLTLHNEVERTTTALSKAKTEAESLLKAVRDLNQKGELNDFTTSIRGTKVTFADLENKIKEMSETGKGSLSLLRSELNAFIADAKRSGKLSGTKESDKNTIFQNNITQWVEDNKQALSNFDDVFGEKIINITESAKNADNITLNGLKNQFKNIQDVYKFLDEFSLGKTEANFVRLQSQFNQFGSSVQSENSALQGLKASFTELQAAIRSNDFNRIKVAMEQYNRSVKTAQASLTSLRVEQKKVNEFANVRLSNSIDEWLRKNTKAVKDYGQQLEEIKRQTEGADAITLKRLRQEFDNVKKAAADAGKLGKSFVQTLQEGATKFSEWVLASGLVMQSIYALKQMFVEVKNIDTAMTNLYKVTDETEAKYNQFLTTSYKNAQNLGRSVSDIVEMTADWAKLGYGIDEATKLAEVSTIYANVGEVDAETSVSDLVTAMKAFNINADDSITIVEKLNKLGNEFAVTSRDLGDGLQNSASMLAMGGNTIEETLALITGGAEITQSTEEVSTALRIGQMRVQGMKGALEEMGETVDSDVESISKMQTHILNLTKGKVNIFDANNEFRSYYDILQDISEVIDSLSSTERADLIETLFGKNRANQGAAVIQAFQSGQVQKALEAATNAEGSALAEQQKWLESTEAKLQQFSAAWQAFSNTIVDSDVVKFFIDSGTGILSTLTKLVDTIGSIPSVAAIAIGAVSLKSGGIIQNLNGELGLFNKTLKNIRNDFGSGQGLIYSLFGSQYTENDIKIINNYRQSLLDTSLSYDDLTKQTKGLSAAGKTLLSDIQSGKKSWAEFAAAQDAAALSTKLLTVALNLGLMLAITAVTAGINYYIQKQEKARQAAIQAGQAAKDESENIVKLREAYLNAENSLDDTEQSKKNLETATDSLLDALGIEREQVQGLADDY